MTYGLARQVHVGAQQARRVDADVATSQIANRSHRKTGRGDEHECQRHLDGHERRERHRAEPPPCRPVSVREARDAGRIPTASVTRTMRTTVNATTPASNATSLRRGITVGVMSRSAGSHQRHEDGADRTAAEREQQAFGEHDARTDLSRGENSGPLAQDRARAHQHRHAHTDQEQASLRRPAAPSSTAGASRRIVPRAMA